MNTQIQTLISQCFFNLKICRILFATCFSALCLIALSAQATTITVTNTNDSGAGSLRQALADANDGDTIDFGITGTLTLITGELLVDKSVTINGPGADNLAVDANHASRVFVINPGLAVTISGLTITNGATEDGGGGGILNSATLTLSNCTLSGNSSNLGGAILNDGLSGGSATLTVTNCTLSGNNSDAYGGGIFNYGLFGGSATLTVTNSTISSNSAHFGGGIYNDGLSGSATLEVLKSTLSGNSASYGGGIFNDSAMLTIGSTILNPGASENIYNNYFGTVSSLGYNLSSDDASAFLSQTGDQNSTDPMLGPLQDNGGPTFTHELLNGSPAIDAGDPDFTPPPDYDQRGSGYDRVANGRVDIGAFEVQPAIPSYAGQVQVPINPDGTSTFSVRRGVVPVKFNLTQGGVATCDLPPATIAVTRTAGGVVGEVNESVYSANADTGSNFRIDSCQYVYNLNSRALGVGTYRVDILIDGQVVGSAVFGLN